MQYSQKTLIIFRKRKKEKRDAYNDRVCVVLIEVIMDQVGVFLRFSYVSSRYVGYNMDRKLVCPKPAELALFLLPVAVVASVPSSSPWSMISVFANHTWNLRSRIQRTHCMH